MALSTLSFPKGVTFLTQAEGGLEDGMPICISSDAYIIMEAKIVRWLLKV